VGHEIGLFDSKNFRASHHRLVSRRFDNLVADYVNGEFCAFGFAGFIVVADEFFGDDVVVGVGVGVECGAAVAGAARGGLIWVFAEEQSGEGTGGGGFADAGEAGEDQAVGEAVGGVGLLEPGDGGLLGEDLGEGEHGLAGRGEFTTKVRRHEGIRRRINHKGHGGHGGKNSNDEIRMTNQIRNPNDETGGR